MKRHPARSLIALSLSASALFLAALPAQATPANPHILPPQSSPYGKTYGEWTVAWWQWALGAPADRSPVTDATGEFCGEGQSGPVWFLEGSLASDAERTCTIPQGKAILVPVSAWAFGAGAYDCAPSVPGVTCDIAVLTDLAATNADAAEVLEVTVDGRAVSGVSRYRAPAPEPFSLEYPEDNILGLPGGTYSPNVADGHWIMLAPPSVGEHIIEVHVRSPGTIYGDIEYTVTTTLEIE